ncbi:ferrous iron transporter A [Pseudomonas citronellolis]|uniref:ferrous iron transporter A n=1 Tax=Pseudomonas citronellolis TaxID=53408 RepID=UPI0023E43AA1|nr:ferrous iron transporter A [Pseudomonas citronellolis]MDF3936167.1 ferrous iron transporter A [Pseudomonas citronellolis]
MYDLQAHRRYRITGYRPGIGAAFRQRLFAMGLLPGAELRVRRVAPLGDPVQVDTRQCSLVLRRADLALLQLAAQD